MQKLKRTAVVLTIIFLATNVFAETLVLKSGKVIEGEVVEKNDAYVKINTSDQILKINFKFVSQETAERLKKIPSVVQEVIKNPAEDLINAERYDSNNSEGLSEIQFLLKARYYPESTWSEIEKELNILFDEIGLPSLKVKAEDAKKTPEGLRNFVKELGAFLDAKGYMNFDNPHRLIRLLVSSLADEDLMTIIEDMPFSDDHKRAIKRNVFACSAISQLGLLIFEILDIDAKYVDGAQHSFIYIEDKVNRTLFVDMTNLFFEYVEIEHYYTKENQYTYYLKEIDKNIVSPVEDYILNGGVYQSLTFTAHRNATASILWNYGRAYYDVGNKRRALANLNRALEINPTDDSVYDLRGIINNEEGNQEQALRDYSKALEINPRSANSYNNRGNSYLALGSHSLALADFNKAISINPDYAEAYGNRGLAYAYMQELNRALLDFDKAISLNPNLGWVYDQLAGIYMHYGNYEKAWENVRSAQAVGYQMQPEFLQKLRQASGKKH